MLLLTISSSEQLGAVILVLLGLLNVWKFCRKRTELYNIILFLTGLLLYLAVTKFCPGVAQRQMTAIENRIPDFLTVKMSLKIEYSIRWIVNTLVNRMGFLMIITWGEQILLLLKKKQKGDFEWFLILTIAFAEIITIFKDRIPALFRFSAEWGITEFGTYGRVVILLWLGILLVSVIAMPFCFENIFRGIIATLLLIASFASSAILIFTATMYASGSRVMYHPSLIMIILELLLLSEIQGESESVGWQLEPLNIAYFGILGCSFYAYASALEKFSAGFLIHWS